MTRYAVPFPEPVVLPLAGEETVFPVRRIYCVGRNYSAHAREMNADLRDPPFFFQKPRDALVPGGGPIAYPMATKSLHHEVELVAAIGRGGVSIPLATALDHVFGYGVGIDLTRRDLQGVAKEKAWPWEMGKAFDASAPCSALQRVEAVGHGPWPISLTVNGSVRQTATTDQMTWSVAEIIVELSKHYALVPGDLIFTGTPEGVGPLLPGDHVEARVEGVGSLSVAVMP